jgi:hypothetical protein
MEFPNGRGRIARSERRSCDAAQDVNPHPSWEGVMRVHSQFLQRPLDPRFLLGSQFGVGAFEMFCTEEFQIATLGVTLLGLIQVCD